MNLSTYDLVSLASPHNSYKLWDDKNPKEKKETREFILAALFLTQPCMGK